VYAWEAAHFQRACEDSAMSKIAIAPLKSDDRAAWEPLARGYKEFYKTPTTDAEYEAAWQRLMKQVGVHGLAAHVDGKLVGIAHYLFHTSTWAESVCYLQDLFTAREARGKGVGRALIEAIATQARRRGAAKYYWLTQDHNAVARTLYDKVAKYVGFIRYDYTID
jgi:GNAT superfamily N-acetyltransferase